MALSSTAAFLKSVPLLGVMEDEALRLIAFSADVVTLAPGEVFIRQGETSRGAYAVRRGRILLEDPQLGRHVAGERALIGESALFSETEWPAHGRAEGEAELIFLSRLNMRRVLAEFPLSTERLRAAVAARLSATLGDLMQVRQTFLSP